MLKLKLERFDFKDDERGYRTEVNRVSVVEAVVGCDEAQKLIALLEVYLQGTVIKP